MRTDTEGVLRNISEKYQIKERKIERTEEPGFLEKVLYVIREEKRPNPKTKKYIVRETYSKFISDPQEDFTSLFEGLISMYPYCLQKYTLSELDMVELNLMKNTKIEIP